LEDFSTGETIPKDQPHYQLADGRIFSEASYAKLKDVGAQQELIPERGS